MTPLVLQTETIALPKRTQAALLNTISAAFQVPRIERIAYVREDMTVTIERYVPQRSDESGSDPELTTGLLTAWQMVRQHADLDVLPCLGDTHLVAVARAAARLHRQHSVPVTMLITSSREIADLWVHPAGEFDLSVVFGVPLVLDADAPADGVIVAGSRISDMVKDIEAAVFCRMRG